MMLQLQGFENVTGFKLCYKTYREMKLKCFVVSAFMSLVKQALISSVSFLLKQCKLEGKLSFPTALKKKISHVLFLTKYFG